MPTKPRNVIGDIAGNYLTLKALLAKMPPGIPLSVGDMVDRGPRSKEVVDFFMCEGEAVLGNHEHMMLADLTGRMSYFGYSRADWRMNGAQPTLKSYGAVEGMYGALEGGDVPKAVLDWIEALPITRTLKYGRRSYLVSHAPQTPFLAGLDAVSQVWNRDYPQRMPGVDLNIYGHNARARYEQDAKGTFALCIDTSHDSPKVLTGIHLPTLELFQQEIID